ncbi:hypothetical protein N7468_005380 [Penicillium chermesinum]|uniref:FAD-binding domain-containing protein n=1 Tax=Penicillium chermesinum TaxID=63820 RepID=A0A9W9NZ44_9EURO|nr:uncharacterized protein N7468_005380 [Penicillium chermesinum]KAJ5232424.1 hypothetical protein N7468_005380 [Penicillium chermesinum]KAJ6172083.1 hypothetical protein N7470_001150 [Penicillium chermesinum]
MADSGTPHAFKVIIIGCGPIGLATAHALHAAGIEFVLLERREKIVEDSGASIIVWPHTLRVLHQLGILEQALEIGDELIHHLTFNAEGHAFSAGRRWERVRLNHGHWALAFHRSELLELMYNALPLQVRQNIHTGKDLAGIEMNEGGVNVTCSDGSTYHGSMVIGADGAHSKTRRLMRSLALTSDPSRCWDPEHPFVASYRLLFGSFPTASEPGQGYDTHSQDKSIAYFSGKRRGWAFMYDKLPKPTCERTEYTSDDTESLAQEFAGYHLTETLRVKDVWPTMQVKGITDLHEGIVQHWSIGRIVLVGDSCHKFTTHLGLGCNEGIQDVVVLCNGLRRLLGKSTKGSPGLSSLEEVFQAYEQLRKDPIQSSLIFDLETSGFETRMHTWSSYSNWILSRYLTAPSFMDNVVLDFAISPQFQKARVLDYINKAEPMNGKFPWLHNMSP